MRNILNLCLALTILFSIASLKTQAAQEAATAMQLPPDQKTYQASIAIFDRRQRIDALEVFLRDYPSSHRADSVRWRLLDLLLDVELAKPSGVSLQLAASFTPDHLVTATPRVEVSDPVALKKA